MSAEIEQYISAWYGELGPEVCMAPEHYLERISEFKAQPASPNSIILLGDSLTEFANWDELLHTSCGFCATNGMAVHADGSEIGKPCSESTFAFRNSRYNKIPENQAILNRGIAGDMIEGMILRLDELKRHNPSCIFLMAGCNNFVKHPSISTGQVWNIYREFISKIRKLLPDSELFVAGTLPLNPMSGDYYEGINRKISELNSMLKENSTSLTAHCDLTFPMGNGNSARSKVSQNMIFSNGGQNLFPPKGHLPSSCIFYDLTPELSDANGFLRSDCTIDGCHLNYTGYRIWASKIVKLHNMRVNCVL